MAATIPPSPRSVSPRSGLSRPTLKLALPRAIRLRHLEQTGSSQSPGRRSGGVKAPVSRQRTLKAARGLRVESQSGDLIRNRLEQTRRDRLARAARARHVETSQLPDSPETVELGEDLGLTSARRHAAGIQANLKLLQEQRADEDQHVATMSVRPLVLPSHLFHGCSRQAFVCLPDAARPFVLEGPTAVSPVCCV
jgi:hypothetical protein